MVLMLVLPLCAGAEGFVTLEKGASGAAVRRLQTRLIELGLLRGKADGLYGSRTQAAVRAGQEHLIALGEAVDPDGRATPQTQALLFDDEKMSALLDLKVGDKGARVSALQAMLYDLRLLSALPDGAYGEQTREAVSRFQQVLVDGGVSGASVTGVADHVTRTALRGDLQGLGMRVPQTFDDAYPEALTGEDLYARGAMLIDLGSGQTLLSKESGRRLYPASTTKIMTLMLALEKLPLDEIVTIPEAAREVPKDSSLTPVTPGESMPFSDLLYGLMLRSGNDAAAAVAVICAGSQEAFVAQMNERAAKLGMADTHYVNPHGYHDPGHYTTPADLARLAQAAMESEPLRQIVSAAEHTMQPTQLRPALVIRVNTDLFDPLSPYYYEGAFGIKSGYTRAAGFCYAGCARRGERLLLAVVMGCRTRGQAWTDMGRLFNRGFAEPRQGGGT